MNPPEDPFKPIRPSHMSRQAFLNYIKERERTLQVLDEELGPSGQKKMLTEAVEAFEQMESSGDTMRVSHILAEMPKLLEGKENVKEILNTFSGELAMFLAESHEAYQAFRKRNDVDAETREKAEIIVDEISGKILEQIRAVWNINRKGRPDTN